MRERIILVLTAVLLLIPGISAAQMQGSGKGHGMMGQGMMSQGMMMSPQMQGNMGMMSDMMTEMYDMMATARMTLEQQKQMLGIMKQMSQMMHQMSTSPGGQMEQLQEQHHKQLQDMKKNLDALHSQVVQ